jgi:hypothetical protein
VFDSEGDLWITNEEGGNEIGAAPNIIEIAAADLESSGSPVPETTLTTPTGRIPYLYRASWWILTAPAICWSPMKGSPTR